MLWLMFVASGLYGTPFFDQSDFFASHFGVSRYTKMRGIVIGLSEG